MKNTCTIVCIAMIHCMIAVGAGETNRIQYADHRVAVFSVTNDVVAVKDFRLYERRRKDSRWNSGKVFDAAAAKEILAALDGSHLWGHKIGAAAYSPWDAESPSITLELAWSADQKDKTTSVWICYGNRRFWWKDSIYQLPEEKGKVLDLQFPKNK